MADFFKIGQAAYGGGADVSKAIGAGLQKGQQIFMAYLGEQKAKREKAESLTKQYIAQIPNVNAISKIPEWMREDVNNYLASEKQRYVEAARALSTMPSSDPNYINAVNQLQSIQTNFSNLNNELNQFQEDTKNYTQDFDSNKISEGFKTGQAEKYTATSAMYTGQGKLNIQNGQLLFNIDGKDYNYSRGEIGDYSAKNFDAQTALTQLGEQIEMDARKGFTFESAKSRYKGKVDTFLTRNGKEGALSMVFDTDPEFITGGPSLQTPEILTAIAEDNFEGKTDKDGNVIPGVYDLITDQLMTGANAVHKGIYKPSAPSATNLTNYDKQLSVIKRNYELQKNNIEPVLKSFLNSNKTTDDALQSFGRLGLNVTGEVQDNEGNIIGIKIKNSEVDEEITVSYSDPASALISIHNALGAGKIGAQPSLSNEFLAAETKESEIEQANMLLATANSVPETKIPTRIIQTGIFKGRTGLEKAQGEARTQRQIEINSIMQARKRYNELADKLGLQKIEFPDIK